ncbi:hypothetical protein MTQ12_10610 [Brevibacterium sp. R8603A2]|uniref:hypothetical protein n=1 Tax=Brevibacterium sp. R8603A2 TaxID=2929779 RepID=UPI001FFA0006|nr:hypothetical protein [Brevibacterium sp. R8603A2]MCK1803494.1 hypothetical protein [Brevibacterium sp. R8603A2]
MTGPLGVLGPDSDPAPPWMLTVHLDSVVFDAETVWQRVGREVLTDCGCSTIAAGALPDPLALALAAGDLVDISEALAQVIANRTGTSTTSALLRMRIFHRLSATARDAELTCPGARAFLARAAATDARLAYLTSMPRSWVEALSEHLALPQPHVLLTAGQVRRRRPHPYSHLLAAHQLGVPARFGVAVESGSDGITAALDAGLRVVAVVPPEMSGGSGRLTLVGDLADVDLAAARAAIHADWARERAAATPGSPDRS